MKEDQPLSYFIYIIINFPYNVRSDRLKQRDLLENRVRVDDTKAPFIRVRTNFCTDEFYSWTACLHGSLQILLQIDVVHMFTGGSVQILDQSQLRLCCGWLSLML